MRQPAISVVRGVILAALGCCAILATGSTARASENGDSISVKFGGTEAPCSGTHLDQTAVAGAPDVQSANWNNADGPSDSLSNLIRDTQGVASTSSATILWNATDTWASGNNNMFSGDDKTLFSCYLDENDAPLQIRVRVTGVPDDFATYDVYVYFLGDGQHRGGVYTVNGNAQFGFVTAASTGTNGYVDAGQTVPPAVGNYLVFRGLSAGTIDIMADDDIGFRAPINGIQIVNTSGAGQAR